MSRPSSCWPRPAYRHLYNRIAIKVHGQFSQQTPVLAGNADLKVFGSAHSPKALWVDIVKVDEMRSRVLLNAGQMRGVGQGLQFAVLPGRTRPRAPLDQVSTRLAMVEVEKADATEPWAKVTFLSGGRFVRPGDRAVLIARAAVVLQRKVRLIRDDPRAALVDRKAALRLVEAMLRSSGEGWVEPADEDEPGDFQLAVDEAGRYEITDSAGQLLPNLRPPIVVVGRTRRGLQCRAPSVHLSRYHAVLQLDNASAAHDLRGQLRVELSRGPRDYEPGDESKGVPFEPGEVPTVEVGDWVFLKIRNDAPRSLNVTVLDLQPEWGSRGHPLRDL